MGSELVGLPSLDITHGSIFELPFTFQKKPEKCMEVTRFCDNSTGRLKLYRLEKKYKW